jgi:Protein of unknown function (DUF4236)
MRCHTLSGILVVRVLARFDREEMARSMGLRFRRSIKVLPGLRINFGLRGISATVGPRGASLNFGRRGTHLNLGLPGTGISYRTRLDRPRSAVPQRATQPGPQWQTEPNVHDGQAAEPINVIQFQSVDAASLGSGSLERVTRLLEKLQRQRKTVAVEIAEATRETYKAERRAKRFSWLREWISPEAVAARREYAEECSDRLEVLKQLNESLVLNVEFAISEQAKSAFTNLANAFDRISRCTRIWDITSAQAVDRYRTRSAASQALDMRLVSFGRSDDSVMATEFKPPHLKNANGADLLVYPAFVAAQVEGRFALLDIRKIDIASEVTRFVAHDGDLPSDAQVIGNTWQYVNKDGSPDRRFANNPTIPVTHYCKIFFQGEGLNEAWMVSNADAGISFSEAVRQYKQLIADSEAEPDGIAPPTADEWPELDLPEKPTSPPIDWKTPLTTYLGLAIIASLLIASLKSPSVFIEHLTNAFRTWRTIDGPAALSSRETKGSVTVSPLPLTANEIAELQRLLKTAGFNPGPADGKAGARTQKALVDWANKRGFTNVGTDRSTLELMRHEDAARRAK